MRHRLWIRQDIVGFDVHWSNSVLSRYWSYLWKFFKVLTLIGRILFSADIGHIFKKFFNVLSSLFLCEVIVIISYILLGIVALARRRSFPLRRYSLSTFSSPSDQRHLLITNCTSLCVTFEINFWDFDCQFVATLLALMLIGRS